MKILIFMSGGFDTYGPSRHLYDALIEDLLLDDHEIHLIESHSTGNDPDVPEKFSNNSNFSFVTVKAKVVKKTAFVRRYLNGVSYCYKCKKQLRKCKGKFDVVLVQSCPWAPFAVSFAKRIVKAPVVWNIQDMFPGSSIANGAMKNRFVQKCFYKFQKIAYKKADYITVISDDMKDKVIEQKVDANKITIISDWFDDKTVEPIDWEQNKFVSKYQMSQKIFYVQYAGTMGYNFDYKMVVNVAERLSKYNNIIFQMIGFGSREEEFKKLVKDKDLKNIIFYPLEPQNMVSHVYSACSVCLIPLPYGVIGNSVPSKIGLLMACKKPVITTADKESKYNKMVNDNRIGYAFGCEEPELVAQAILRLSNNQKTLIELGMNGFSFGKVIFSRHYNTNKYIKLFNDIYNKKERASDD